ncbi:hypothetical protein IAI10_16780 [Clostridium sp. 19966]|uniref:hypothetical protein n=1 Tax=Clostridium sp. 19966 TaxID=2768166 RepID=UPI0028DE5FB3|nr:hypothetical protein [Clostridium sp. 19966]MDT8718323.1 hypothetical protein [Clostridium sp. 19966]
MTINLPCEPGAKVYCVESNNITEREVICFLVGISGTYATCYQQKAKVKTYDASFDMFGKTIFLSRTEAQRSLPKPTV